MIHLKRLLPAALVLTSVLTACKDSLGPDSVDANAIQSAMEGMTSAFDNASFQSMASLSSFFPVYPAVAASSASLSLLRQSRGPFALTSVQRNLAATRLEAAFHANPLALFPANVLGKTYEWNGNTHQYEVGNLTGAPSNGIRIMLYTVSTITGEPIAAQQLGYIELTDEGTAQSDQLGVVITLGATTVADYAINYQQLTNSATLGAKGFIHAAAGSNQVDFDYNLTGTSALSTIEATLTGNNGGSIFVHVHDDGNTGVLQLRVGQGDNKIEMNVTGPVASSDITGNLKYNGTTVANITGTIDAPVFTAITGRTLRPSELASLNTIFGGALVVVGGLAIAIFAPGIVVSFL